MVDWTDERTKWFRGSRGQRRGSEATSHEITTEDAEEHGKNWSAKALAERCTGGARHDRDNVRVRHRILETKVERVDDGRSRWWRWWWWRRLNDDAAQRRSSDIVIGQLDLARRGVAGAVEAREG